MKIEIDVPEEALRDAATQIIADALFGQYRSDGYKYKKLISECVREVIYKDKENIVDRVVQQAARECKNKALKKILEAMEET